MNNLLVDAAVSRSRTTLLLMVMVVLGGIVARLLIPIESNPNVEVPIFMVVVPHEGISPEDAERLLVKPLEVELRTVEGVDEVRAFAYEGTARVIVEFDAAYDLDQALLDVRAVVDRAEPEFPSTAEEAFILEQTAADYPIVQVNLVGSEGAPERVIYNLAQEIPPRREGARGRARRRDAGPPRGTARGGDRPDAPRSLSSRHRAALQHRAAQQPPDSPLAPSTPAPDAWR